MSDRARLMGETAGARRPGQRIGQQVIPTDRIPGLASSVAAELAGTLAGLEDAVDDAAAATAGVGVGEMYRNGSVLMVRVA